MRDKQDNSSAGVDRRAVLRGGATAAFAAATTGFFGPLAAYADEAPNWRIPYGAAVQANLLDSDAAYKAAVLEHCRVLTPEGGMKWANFQPERGVFAFDEADRYAAFARANHLAARGHTLVWAGAMPNWTSAIAQGEAEAILTGYIDKVMTRYAGTVSSWDVVNEPMAEVPRNPQDLRSSIWLERLGPGYIETALKAAAQADPSARLTINEYDIEYVGEPYRTKRQGFLNLIRTLRARDVPLHAVGLQGHLRGDVPIDRHALSAFVSEVAAMGLDVLVTELDVIDNMLPGPAATLDKAVAAKVDEFLGAVFAGARPKTVITWGISDRFTWVPTYYKRTDGLANRPLPLDADYKPKPMLAVIERYCR